MLTDISEIKSTTGMCETFLSLFTHQWTELHDQQVRRDLSALDQTLQQSRMLQSTAVNTHGYSGKQIQNNNTVKFNTNCSLKNIYVQLKINCSRAEGQSGQRLVQ